MNLNKNIKFISLFFLLFFLFGFCGKVFGKENSFVTIVNPVRGDELFAIKPADPLEGVKYQKSLIDQNDFKATWLLRYDIFPFLGNFFKNNFGDQELGIFLEVTPKLAEKARVNYPQGGIFWHDANKIFLSGFKPEDRIKIINTVFGDFKEQIGYFPKSVGAWHIDALSAEYMREKFGVTGVLICADQFGTDGYQIWGGWWGVPYYPSKYNILMPAQTLGNKLDLVVFWWAARDPDLGYGGSVGESTYSVQVNDYIGHGFGVDYFGKLLNEYLTGNPANKFGQLTIGLENDSDWRRIGNGFEQQMEEVSRRVKNDGVNVVTMEDFSDWYREKFQKVSPSQTIGNWVMTTDFRVGFFDEDGKKYIKDLRIYNEKWPEANLLTANPWQWLSLNNPYKIDTVRFNDSAKIADFEINKNELIKKFGGQKIPFKGNNLLFLLFYSCILLTLIYFLKNSLPLLIVIIVGSISLCLPMVKSGLVYPFGMGFWGPNGHDGIWHLALIEQLKNFSLNNPVFSGAILANYHFGFDLIAAVISKLTKITSVNVYFQVLPPVTAVLIGVMTYKFVKKLSKSNTAGWWSVFFVYFGGSWGWLVTLFKSGSLGGESMFWANQAVSALINPPFALSIIILLLGLIKFLDYLINPNRNNLLFCAVLFGILVQIKVYAGIIVLGSLLLLSFTTILRRIVVIRRTKDIWKLFFLCLFIALAVFTPFNLKASSLLVFSPLWFPRTMLAYSDRLGWFKLENARIAYLNSGKWLKWLLAEAGGTFIFIFGNLGTRLIGVLYGGWLFKTRKINRLEIFLLFALFISLVLPLLFIQKGNSWNTIQFFYYFQFFMALFAGITVSRIIKAVSKNKTGKFFSVFLAVLIVIFTLPTSLITLRYDYWPARPPSRVSIEELEALDYLKNQVKGIVLSYPFDPKWRGLFSEPKPLYAYETTAYISGLSGQLSFLADEMNLEIMDYNWKPRREDAVRFFLTADREWGRNFLLSNKIKYIYLVKGQKMNLGLGDINGEKIFENGEISIFRVN